jgi:hypothetical protein
MDFVLCIVLHILAFRILGRDFPRENENFHFIASRDCKCIELTESKCFALDLLKTQEKTKLSP